MFTAGATVQELLDRVTNNVHVKIYDGDTLLADGYGDEIDAEYCEFYEVDDIFITSEVLEVQVNERY